MTTNRRTDVNLNVAADISNAMGGLRRIQQEAIQTQRRIDQATGGNLSRAGRIGGTIGRGAGVGVGIVGAGAGLQAGLAVLEQLVEQLIEMFEGTDIFTNFVEAGQSLLKALAPVVGVLIQGLTPALKALEPLLVQLAVALSPVIEQLTLGLTDLIAALVPILIPAIQLLGVSLTWLATLIRKLAQLIASILNRLPGINLNITPTSAYQTAAGQLAQNRANQNQENRTIVIVDGQVIENTASRTRRLNADYGIGVIN